MPAVRITGLGLVTPLGHAAWPTFHALLEGKTLALRAAGLPHDLASADLVRAVGTVGFAHGSSADPTVTLAERAAREALLDAGLDPDDRTAHLRTFLATSKGAVTALTRLADVVHSSSASFTSDFPLPTSDFRLSPHAHFADALRRRLPCLGLTSHHVAACASSLYALDAARRWLLEDQATHEQATGDSQGQSAISNQQSAIPSPPPSAIRNSSPSLIPHPSSTGSRRRAIVITAESALLPLFIHSYRRLGVLAPTNQGPAAYVARPLDRDRTGFQLADLAAVVVLERVDCPDATAPAAPPSKIQNHQSPITNHKSKTPLTLLATAAAAETYDLIRPDPDMPALRRMAQQFFLLARPDLIHLHAPGTADHDAFELNAIAAALEKAESGRRKAEGTKTPDVRGAMAWTLPPSDFPLPPSLYAVKGAVGHGLGAAGLVSLVVAALCARARQRPPMPWLQNPLQVSDSFTPLHALAHPLPPRSTHALFAAGFGGHTAGALMTTE
jgi:3-oxoacyl-[acyl-carrier-protein] synthase II